MGKRNYIGFAKMGNTFGPAEGNGEYKSTLPRGHYKVDYDPYKDELTLTNFVPKLDNILNLNIPEIKKVLANVERFLSPETAQKYKEQGYLLKRSFLFHGPPGTGKSVLSCQITDFAVQKKDALVFYPSDFDALERLMEVIDETDKDRFMCISLEEFDGLVNSKDEDSWTTLLDGQFQSGNRIIVANTNYVQRIPQRLLRPGRFSSLIHIPALSPEARTEYFKLKGVDEKLTTKLVEQTNGFTVDELKEIVQNVCILGEDPDDVIGAIQSARTLGKSDGEEEE